MILKIDIYKPWSTEKVQNWREHKMHIPSKIETILATMLNERKIIDLVVRILIHDIKISCSNLSSNGFKFTVT